MQIADNLTKKLNSQYTVITCGEDGVFCYDKKSKKFMMIGTKARGVADVTGAGDTFAATLALGMVSGLNVFEASQLANYASGIVVEKVGTAITNIEELEKRIKEDSNI